MESRFTIGVYLNTSPQDYTSFEKPDYRLAYFEFSEAIKKQGGQMVLVTDQASYAGKGQFPRGWVITSVGKYEEIQDPRATVIFNKGNFVPTDKTPLLNHPQLQKICDDKFLMYELFSRHCPRTFLANNQIEFLAALQKIRTPLAVAKPLAGYEGHGVLIEPLADLAAKTPFFPSIVQEFIDTSGGVPGIIEGYHDLRVTLLGKEVSFSWVRTPPPGKLTANIAQGGIFRMIPADKIPAEVMKIVWDIDAHMEQYGTRFYCLDFGVSPDGPKLIELNSKPGIFPNKDAPEFMVMKEKLAKVFDKMSLPG